MTAVPQASAPDSRIPRVVWTLGIVSMLMDISSEMIHGLLPVYLMTVLGASATTVGFIEGIAEATASITKIFSGALSDWTGKRQRLAAFGYGLSALTKPIFPLAASIGWLVGARFLDRVGKGIRGAPRDALIADVTPAEIRGAAFGLRQSLDTIGAISGPLLALALMAWTANNFRLVFWVAVIPGMLAFLLIAFGVRDAEPDPAATRVTTSRPAFWAQVQSLPGPYWGVVAIASLLAFARISEAFLILRGQQQGLAVALAPLVLVAMNVVYTLSAYPLGRLADRSSKVALLGWGCVALGASQCLLAANGGLLTMALGVLLYGLHLGLTQGLLSALVAGTAPATLRGTAFGMFNLVSGLAMLGSGVLAGALWDRWSSSVTFIAGAVAALLTLLALPALRGAATLRPAA